MIGATAALVFAALLAASLWRLHRHPDAWADDLKHPVRHVFLAAVPIALLLLVTAAVSAGLGGPVLEALWWTASLLQLSITAWVMSRWWRSGPGGGLPWASLTPALFIPIVGNVLLIARVRELGATVQWILETHVHADHLSAAPYLKQELGGQLGIGQHITTVQKVFGSLFNAGAEFAHDGRQFDHLFSDGETFHIGGMEARAMHTPGHTPACMTYVIGDANQTAAFVGDTLFMPDYGTARCDFPGGDARTLFRSINKVLSLPPETKLYMCHDYQPGGREVQYVSTVAEEREKNVHVRNGISEEEFVAMRHARDATLGMPTLILPSVQINMRAGQLPEPESNGTRYIKIPLNAV